MSRGQALRQVNNFTGGLITEASPLAFPENSLSKAMNVVINQDGSLSRRLPFNKEIGEADYGVGTNFITYTTAGYELVSVSKSDWVDQNRVVYSFVFKNASTSNYYYGVHEIYQISIDGSISYIGEVRGNSYTAVNNSQEEESFAISTNDVAFHEDRMYVSRSGGVHEYTGGIDTSYSSIFDSLLYRDFEGITDYSDITTGTVIEVDERPTSISNFHLYSMFNNGWRDEAESVVSNEDATTTTSYVPFRYVYNTLGFYPSLKDSYTESVVTSSTTAKTIGLFSPWVMQSDVNRHIRRVSNGSVLLALGDEGTSRRFYGGADNTLPDWTDYYDYIHDFEDASITAINSINGRMWYGVEGRPFNVMFSQVSENNKDDYYTKCYQTDDPNVEDSQIIDTDGGVVSLKNSGIVYNILEVGDKVLVIAANGVWALHSPDGAFKPTDLTIEKVLDAKITSKKAAEATGAGVFVAAENGFNIIFLNEYKNLSVVNLSNSKIKSLYKKIFKGLEYCSKLGMVYEPLDNTVTLYYTDPESRDRSVNTSLPLRSLTYNIDMQCYYEGAIPSKYTLYKIGDTEYGWINSTSESVPVIPFYHRYVGVCLPSIATTEKLGPLSQQVYDTAAPYDTSTLFKVWAMPSSLDEMDDSDTVYLLNCSDMSLENLGDMDVEAVIPHDLWGAAHLDKIVSVATFFTANEGHTYPITSDSFEKLDPIFTYAWDWGAGTTGTVELGRNIKQPYQQHYLEPEVIVDKVKIPGKGKALTVSLGSGSNRYFKSYGYIISASGADKE